MLKVLCIHGIGGHSSEDLSWQQNWRNALNLTLLIDYEVDFWCYDHYFENYKVSEQDIDNLIHQLSYQTNIYGWDIKGILNNTIGMVAKWFLYNNLREKLNEDLSLYLTERSPHVIIGHSFGSILSYKVLRNSNVQSYFISIGSQINNRAVKSFLDKLEVPSCVRKWYHLYNPRDIVFTEPIKFETRFEQLITEFSDNFHSPFMYLTHPSTLNMWKYITENYSKFILKEKISQLLS
jgi:hypothetical protein